MTDSDLRDLGIVETLPVHLTKEGEQLVGAAERVDVKQSRAFSAYAPPMAWGPEVTVASHMGSVTYNISYRALGNTLVLGKVTYYKGPGNQDRVTEQFTHKTTITTSNSMANVLVRFRGVPLGSAVEGTITP